MKHIINKKTFLFLLTAMGILLGSCSKSFTDKKPYNASVVSDAILNEADMNTSINGLYSSLRATDFYGRTYAVKGDLMADNCFLSSQNSGRYTQFNLYNIVVTDGYASNIWANGYKAIKNANLVINATIAMNDNVSQLQSEAYAIRALTLFDLCRNFAKPYTDNPDGPGVPIVLMFKPDAKPARNTIKEVYTQVLSDLNKAYSLAKFNQGTVMTFSATGKTRAVNSSFLSKYAIKAILARVYQSMGDWTNARDAALDVVNNGGFTLVASSALVGYWNGTSPRNDKAETMFEVTSDANNSVGDGTLANLYVPKTANGSYGDILATQAFYNSYAATDARKLLYNPTTRSGQLGIAYYVTKYPIDPTNFDDVKIVRYADVLLILAEAYYNLADGTNALKYLNQVAQKRDPAFTGYISTGTQVLEDILNERSKEFAFEGYRFWDLYRLKRSFVKPQAQDASNAIIQSIMVTPATTNLIFPIPNDERLINPGISQNPGY
ncbi:MAG: RagB/SusD family nutrient uptake outer membrane protein [Chitinophagaceae bacterium]